VQFVFAVMKQLITFLQSAITQKLFGTLALHFNMPRYNFMVAKGKPVNWMKSFLRTGSKNEKRKKVGILFTYWWNIWKERNNKIFRNEARSPARLMEVIRAEIITQDSVFLPVAPDARCIDLVCFQGVRRV
jgi:hypothetical protein